VELSALIVVLDPDHHLTIFIYASRDIIVDTCYCTRCIRRTEILELFALQVTTLGCQPDNTHHNTHFNTHHNTHLNTQLNTHHITMLILTIILCDKMLMKIACIPWQIQVKLGCNNWTKILGWGLWAVTKCWWLLASHVRFRLGWAVTIRDK